MHRILNEPIAWKVNMCGNYKLALKKLKADSQELKYGQESCKLHWKLKKMLTEMKIWAKKI